LPLRGFAIARVNSPGSIWTPKLSSVDQKKHWKAWTHRKGGCWIQIEPTYEVATCMIEEAEVPKIYIKSHVLLDTRDCSQGANSLCAGSKASMWQAWLGILSKVQTMVWWLLPHKGSFWLLCCKLKFCFALVCELHVQNTPLHLVHGYIIGDGDLTVS
jgi:hypothetical protein